MIQSPLGMKEARTKLKARRLEIGFTQRDVATYSGVKLPVYQHYESGNRKLANANYKTIKAIARALVCPISDII